MLCETLVTDSRFLLVHFVCLKFTQRKYIELNQRVSSSSMILRTILSTELVQNFGVIPRPLQGCGIPSGPAWPPVAAPPTGKMTCFVFVHGNLSDLNQRLRHVRAALLTILSTQNVQKCTVCRDRRTLSLATRTSPVENSGFPLKKPRIWRAAIFLLMAKFPL